MYHLQEGVLERLLVGVHGADDAALSLNQQVQHWSSVLEVGQVLVQGWGVAYHR